MVKAKSSRARSLSIAPAKKKPSKKRVRLAASAVEIPVGPLSDWGPNYIVLCVVDVDVDNNIEIKWDSSAVYRIRSLDWPLYEIESFAMAVRDGQPPVNAVFGLEQGEANDVGYPNVFHIHGDCYVVFAIPETSRWQFDISDAGASGVKILTPTSAFKYADLFQVAPSRPGYPARPKKYKGEAYKVAYFSVKVVDNSASTDSFSLTLKRHGMHPLFQNFDPDIKNDGSNPLWP